MEYASGGNLFDHVSKGYAYSARHFLGLHCKTANIDVCTRGCPSLLWNRKGLSEKDARWFFKQLMLALDYCHKMVRVSCASCACGTVRGVFHKPCFVAPTRQGPW